MSVTVTAISGPDDAAFIYLKGVHDDAPQIIRTRAVTRSAIAVGHLTVPGERDALIAEIEQTYSDYVASQSALQEL